MLVYQRTSSGCLRSHAPPPSTCARAVMRNGSAGGSVEIVSGGVNVSLSLGVFLICGKMARIVCGALDVSCCNGVAAAHGGGLLLDILKVMYIKAELFWLGRCQNTFI